MIKDPVNVHILVHVYIYEKINVQLGPPVSRLAATPPPAATSVTMTTKKPISSSTVKTRLVDVKLARKMAASRQPESRVKSTASKGISYSAVVGGTKVKEDNPAFNVVSAH